jgi:1-acyl-sn-glycerol-3-phosphate acyltransferase
VVIFPEGTRTSFPETKNSEELQNWLGNMKFHRGAAAVSLRSSIPIVPVLIHYSPKVLGRGQKWYQIPTRLCRASIRFFEPVPSFSTSRNGASLEGSQDTPSSRRELTEKLGDFFKGHITSQNLSMGEDKNFQPSEFHASFRP